MMLRAKRDAVEVGVWLGFSVDVVDLRRRVDLELSLANYAAVIQ